MNHLSPLDGRHVLQLTKLAHVLGDESITATRLRVEWDYFLSLVHERGVGFEQYWPKLAGHRYLLGRQSDPLPASITRRLSTLEIACRHDVKSLELYLRELLTELIPEDVEVLSPLVHFGLTSQDVVSLAYATQLQKYKSELSIVDAGQVQTSLTNLAKSQGSDMPFPALTHGQPAVPTTFRKLVATYSHRLQDTFDLSRQVSLKAKFGGAVGDLQAHKLAYPSINWGRFMDRFVKEFGVGRSQYTTQTDYYDSFCQYFDAMRGYANSLLDMCRDMWYYHSIGYLVQTPHPGQVGSSTMPQKVNPIGLENAEGNLEIAITWLTFLSNKLRTSRLQRDLSDSTVMRNIGVPFGHLQIAQQGIVAHLSRVAIGHNTLSVAMSSSYQVLGEAVQILLRTAGYHDAYEMAREAFQGTSSLDSFHYKKLMRDILPDDVSQELRDRLINLTPDYLVAL